MLFSIVTTQSFTPTNRMQGFQFLLTFANIALFFFLDNSHPDRCKMISYYVSICISLMTSGVEHFFILLLATCMTPLEKCLLSP